MMAAKTSPHCDELGACQHRAPHCTGCMHPLPPSGFVFAPGVIDGPHRRAWLTDRRVEQLARFALVLACLSAVFSVLGMVIGFVVLKGIL